MEADRQYHAAVGVDSEMRQNALRRHEEELKKIIEKLTSVTPDSFDDVKELLKFSIESIINTFSHYGGDVKTISAIRMLNNVSKGIFKVEVRSTLNAVSRELRAREKAAEEFQRIGA